MKALSKKVIKYKADKRRKEAQIARQEMLNKMGEADKAEYLKPEQIRQKKSIKQFAELLAIADSIGNQYL